MTVEIQGTLRVKSFVNILEHSGTFLYLLGCQAICTRLVSPNYSVYSSSTDVVLLDFMSQHALTSKIPLAKVFTRFLNSGSGLLQVQ